ncbi:helix-turn-helix domain-containing protein [Acuticoccus sp. I52.16.1]|uniref:helix-turn-helix domain-containing protein n=1 Tax=Acuticoccus sp. I52.16.1 TaxID=2928472 RepID=UPI001FD17C1B|nr:helix-turn-helix transcriptional regulator [Acuticoccus sp. I52.16.1]UOM34204.1 helix-turn-helix domain-containing protein [Acuticoccus sp. I52.16.1]
MQHQISPVEINDWRSRLRSCLTASGKTRSQVCSEAGLNPAYLTQILEQKGATPRIDNLQKLANVLQTTVTYLVDGVDMGPEATECLSLYTAMTPERRSAVMCIMRDLAARSTALDA